MSSDTAHVPTRSPNTTVQLFQGRFFLRMPHPFPTRILLCLFLLSTAFPGLAEQPGTNPVPAIPVLAVDRPSRTDLVDFHKELLPALQASCLPCHNRNNTKGDLNLENPGTMAKGGESGPALIPGQAAGSLLLKVAAHAVKPRMPPRENKVNAVDLTPQQLGILALWIDQGAPEGHAAEAPIAWQAVPSGFQPIYAVAVTHDGQLAACGRGNQIHLYRTTGSRLLQRLEDPALGDGAAQRDIVNALAFSPDGHWLAAGGFRETRLWHWQPARPIPEIPLKDVVAAALSENHSLLAVSRANGAVELLRSDDGTSIRSLAILDPPPRFLRFSSRARSLAIANSQGALRVFDVDSGGMVSEASLGTEPGAMTWLDEGRNLAVSGIASPTIRIFQRVVGTNKEPSQPYELLGHTARVTTLVDASPIGIPLVSGSEDGTVRLWSADWKIPPRILGVGSEVTDVAVVVVTRSLAISTRTSGTQIWSTDAEPRLQGRLAGDPRLGFAADAAEHSSASARAEYEYLKSALKRAEDDQKKRTDDLAKSNEKLVADDKALAEKRQNLIREESTHATAVREKEEFTAALKKATDRFESARKASDAARTAAREAVDRQATDRAIEEVAVRASETGEAKAQFDHASAELPPKLRQTEEKIANAGKAMDALKPQIERAKIQHDTTEGDVRLADRNLEAAKTALAETLAARAANGLEITNTAALARQATASRDAAAGRGHVWVHSLPDTGTVVTLDDEGRMTVWDAKTFQPGPTISLPARLARPVALVEGGVLVLGERALERWRFDGTWAIARRLGTGEAGSVFVDRVNAVAFSPDGRFLATGGGEPSRSGELKIWLVEDGLLVRDLGGLHSDSVLSVAFSPRGGWLASGGADRFARVTDWVGGRAVRHFEGHTHHVLAVAWNADGRVLASGGGEGVVKLWNRVTGERLRNVDGFGKEVTGVARLGLAPEFLAVSGAAQARVFKEDGSQVRTLPSGSSFFSALAATLDGRWAVCGGDDGVLRVWDVREGKIACEFESKSGMARTD